MVSTFEAGAGTGSTSEATLATVPAAGSPAWQRAPEAGAVSEYQDDHAHQADPLRRARLRWRARRGLLENDLFLQRFFDRYEHTLSDQDVAGLTRLLDLTDNDLMDLLLGWREPDGELALPEVTGLLGRLREA